MDFSFTVGNVPEGSYVALGFKEAYAAYYGYDKALSQLSAFLMSPVSIFLRACQSFTPVAVPVILPGVPMNRSREPMPGQMQQVQRQ